MTAGRGRRAGAVALGLAAVIASGASCTASAPEARDARDATAVPSATAAAATQPGVPSTAQLKTALLAPADMGSSFTQLPNETSSGGTHTNTPTVTGCPQLEFVLSVGSSTSPTDQGVTYQAGEVGPTVAESLITAPPRQLAATYADDRAALISCKQLTIHSQGGVNLTLKLTPISFGGPQSAAAQMDGTLQGVRVNAYLAIDDVGRAELAYFFVQVGSTSSQVAAHYFQVADAKAARQLDTLS
jgi:hypothetical protein